MLKYLGEFRLVICIVFLVQQNGSFFVLISFGFFIIVLRLKVNSWFWYKLCDYRCLRFLLDQVLVFQSCWEVEVIFVKLWGLLILDRQLGCWSYRYIFKVCLGGFWFVIERNSFIFQVCQRLSGERLLWVLRLLLVIDFSF